MSDVRSYWDLRNLEAMLAPSSLCQVPRADGFCGVTGCVILLGEDVSSGSAFVMSVRSWVSICVNYPRECQEQMLSNRALHCDKMANVVLFTHQWF